MYRCLTNCEIGNEAIACEICIKSEIYHVSAASAISSPGKGFKVERCGGPSFIRIYIVYTISTPISPHLFDICNCTRRQFFSSLLAEVLAALATKDLLQKMIMREKAKHRNNR